MPYHTGTFMSGRIYDRATGKTTNLWYPESGVVMTSLEVEVNLGMSHKISANLELPYQEGLSIIESTLFDISNVLMVRFGYSQTGFMSPWIAGVMLDPSVSIGDTWSVTLQAQGAGAIALARSATKGWSGTRLSIIQEISGRFNWMIDIDSTTSRLTEPVNVTQAGETYFLLLSSLIHDAGYNFWIGSNAYGVATLFLRSRENPSQPTRAFVKFGQIDRSKNQYPILEFSSESSAFQVTGDAGLKAVWMDDDGNVVTYTGTESGSALPHSGEGSAVGGKEDAVHAETGLQLDQLVLSYEQGDCMFLPALWAGPSQMEKATQARHDEIMTLSGRQASVSTIGIPNMLPGELVTIYGCSKRYDGNYGVMSVKHTVGDDGFMTSFEARRDAFARGFGFGDDLFPTETSPAQGTD